MIPAAILMITDDEDREFIERLFLENELAMFLTAYKVVHDYHTAMDMVSESCISMIDKIGYLRGIEDKNRPSYILTMVKNNSLMYLRKRRREATVLMEERYAILENEDRNLSVDAELMAEVEMQEFHEALSKIYPRDRELLEMKYFEKISDNEIARRMSIAPASVRFYLTKARRNLGDEIRRQAEKG